MSIKEKTNPGVIARIKKILVGDFVETGATASQNIGAGKFFVWRNKLKQAKSAISSGDTFTEGTNMEAVAEGALNELNDSLLGVIANTRYKMTTVQNVSAIGVVVSEFGSSPYPRLFICSAKDANSSNMHGCIGIYTYNDQYRGCAFLAKTSGVTAAGIESDGNLWVNFSSSMSYAKSIAFDKV